MNAPLSSGGQQDKRGDAPVAPLVPHPASRLFPPPTDDEFTALCKIFAEGDPHQLIGTVADHLNLTIAQRACLAVELAEWYDAEGGA